MIRYYFFIGFLLCTPLSAEIVQDSGALYYTRSGTDLRILIQQDLTLTPSQLIYLNSELDLTPSTHLEGLKTIDFRIFDRGEEEGEFAYASTVDELTLQTPTSDNSGISITLRAAIGARLFYTLSEKEKQQIRDLYDATEHRLDDNGVAGLFGSWYAGWGTNSEAALKGDLQPLIDQAQTGKTPSYSSALDKLITAASFFTSRNQVLFYKTPDTFPPVVSGQMTVERASLNRFILRLGTYSLLISNGQIIGVLNYNPGPSMGQPVYFKTPYTLPALAWARLQSTVKAVAKGPLKQADSILTKTRGTYVVGPSPITYIPAASPEIQILSRDHPVETIKP